MCHYSITVHNCPLICAHVLNFSILCLFAATELPPEAAIDLRLERALSSLHWDEYDQTPSSYFGGAVWSPHRPAGVSVEEVMATVRAAWPTRPFFATGGLVAADVGCHTMVLRYIVQKCCAVF